LNSVLFLDIGIQTDSFCAILNVGSVSSNSRSYLLLQQIRPNSRQFHVKPDIRTKVYDKNTPENEVQDDINNIRD